MPRGSSTQCIQPTAVVSSDRPYVVVADLRYLFLETEYKDTAFLWQCYSDDSTEKRYVYTGY